MTDELPDLGPPPLGRTRRAARNVAVGVVAQVVVLGFTVATRTVFLQQLSVELLGVHTLLNTTVALVGVADLGLQGALMYTLYRPLADGDRARINAVLGYARRLYALVAVTIALLGVVAIVPVVRLAEGGAPDRVVVAALLLMVAASVASYFMADRQLLMLADQRYDVVKGFTLGATVLRCVLQIAVLLLWQSFLAFIAIQAVATVLGNVAIFVWAGRRHPYLGSTTEALGDAERAGIRETVRAMMNYRIAGVIIHQVEPLMIAAFAGVAVLGLYANYLLIIGTAQMFTDIAFAAVTATIGNAVASHSASRSYDLLLETTLVATVLFTVLTTLMAVAIPDLLTVWLGASYVMSPTVLFLALANFLAYGLSQPVMSFRTATGLFQDVRYLLHVTAGLSIAGGLLLGNVFGITGVLAATLIARLATIAWLEPLLLLRRYLHGSFVRFVLIQLSGVVVVLAVSWPVTAMVDQWDLTPAQRLSITIPTAALASLGLLGILWARTPAGRTLEQRTRLLVSGRGR